MTGIKVTADALRAMKSRGEKIAALTAYDFPMAQMLDAAGIPLLMVGDSLGMVVYGLESTLGVTLEMMIAHGQAVMRGSQRACVVVDMPFGTYQESPQIAFRAAARLLAETGAQAVKLEGGAEMADTIAFLTARGVPVMGHVGLTPQAVNVLGGFRTQGRDEGTARRVLTDAEVVATAGAFAVVVEGTVESLAREITTRIPIPTIGIGASPYCDGQVLVVDDLLGVFTDFTPKFVRRYAELGPQISAAAEAYANDVRQRRFPGPENCVGAPPPPPRPRAAPERPRGDAP